ncbi:hypothetical protein DFQ28_005233 [Apophysomyces sp. BC1034]|nr:hypothetical protein DFQ30_010301 [Apophysomyces sp. BC1015]KAG0170773.1 hypothetical protein DFQ29_009111 [Apophysomyces sp. BC1021]KAG0188197.1 hypothetical protein DFQ28_005233 [Apophysomyces sp. BC1034]
MTLYPTAYNCFGWILGDNTFLPPTNQILTEINMFKSWSSEYHPTERSSHQAGRQAYVEALVDVNAIVIEAIWQRPATASVVPLRAFIREVLQRSRTTYSTLQAALFYLFRARPSILSQLGCMQSCDQPKHQRMAYISCGRRMFLASLVIASKFLQDKTYRNSAWAKIAGLPVAEINTAERLFLDLMNYELFISQPTFELWHQLLHMQVQAKTGAISVEPSSPPVEQIVTQWTIMPICTTMKRKAEYTWEETIVKKQCRLHQ